MLKAIKWVSAVFFFSTDKELENLIKNTEPDLMIVGDDYRDKKVIGSEYAKELYFFPRDERYSTTKILNYGK